NHCAAWMFTVTFTYPTQAVGIFKIVALCSIRIKLSGFKQLFNFLHLIQKYFLLITFFVYICVVSAEKIRVENAGIAIFPQENQRIGQRLEPMLHRSFKFLKRL